MGGHDKKGKQNGSALVDVLIEDMGIGVCSLSLCLQTSRCRWLSFLKSTVNPCNGYSSMELLL